MVKKLRINNYLKVRFLYHPVHPQLSAVTSANAFQYWAPSNFAVCDGTGLHVENAVSIFLPSETFSQSFHPTAELYCMSESLLHGDGT